MVDAKMLLPALIVPLVLIISGAVFTNFASESRSAFETSVTNEELGTLDSSPKLFYTDYPAKPDSMTVVVKNTTSGSVVTATVSIDYNGGYDEAEVNVTSSTTGSDIKVYANYTAYTGSGWESFQKVRTGTWGGFKLASMLPYIIIAMIVLSVLLGAFTFR